jgi:cytochrome c-type biogenesis protein CcmH
MLAMIVALAMAQVARADSRMAADPMANTQLSDPTKERAARDLMEKIRCLVCQGQSIADSDAETAGDMRALIRTRIAAGEKPEAVKAWLVERYGTYITYDPPFSGATALVWLMPLLLLGVGGLVVRGRIRRRT